MLEIRLGLKSFLFPISISDNGLGKMNCENFRKYNLFCVKGRNALITGGTSGIGFMMAEGLIVNGITQLFITGNEGDVEIKERVAALQSLADKCGAACKIFGFVTLIHCLITKTERGSICDYSVKSKRSLNGFIA